MRFTTTQTTNRSPSPKRERTKLTEHQCPHTDRQEWLVKVQWLNRTLYEVPTCWACSKRLARRHRLDGHVTVERNTR